MSVRPNISPPEIDFKLLVGACVTFGFLVLALTANPIKDAATLTAGFRKLFQAVCVPLKLFCSYLFMEPPSNLY